MSKELKISKIIKFKGIQKQQDKTNKKNINKFNFLPIQNESSS